MLIITRPLRSPPYPALRAASWRSHTSIRSFRMAQQPSWEPPSSVLPVPVLKVYNSLTRTKVCSSYIYIAAMDGVRKCSVRCT